MRLLVVAVLAVAMAACASMGRPEGGPKDETPPVFVKSNPMPGATNVARQKIVMEFDENLKLDDPMNKIVFSPAQTQMPKTSAVGHKLTVEFQDSLVPNTTYTLDFTDAIRDLNENNPIDGFAFDFSTGDVVDSLCISGMVFQAENLEPAQGMLVGVHSNLSDTAITNLPFERLTKTNQYGQFTLRNLKAGTYRVFAIDDKNRDNRWDRSENIAFYGVPVTPSAVRTQHADTLKNAAGEDSVAVYEKTEFAPNDVLLTWFNENYKPQYLTKYERKEHNKVTLQMAVASDSLPELRFVGGKHDGELFSRYSVLNSSLTRDTLEYWIADTTVAAMDSLILSARFMRTDTLDRLVWGTDTLKFIIKGKKAPKKKDKEKDKKEELEGDSIKPEQTPLLNIKFNNSNTVDVFQGIVMQSGEPIQTFDPEAFHMEIMRDSVWEEIARPEFHHPDSLHPLVLGMMYEWEPGMKYRVSVDSLGVTGIYGLHNGPVKSEFTVRPLEEYANITFNISNLYGPAVVQLLNSQDKPVKSVRTDGNRGVLRHVMPGTYYARLFIDRDSNGTYTNGSVKDSLQPEDVYYYPKKIMLKKNWDVEQSWDIFETPVELQKPLDIKKNKPKSNKEDQQDDTEEDDQYYDEFGNPAVDPDDPFGKRKGNNYNRGRNNNTGNGRTGLGGLGGFSSGGGLQRATDTRY